MSCGQGSRVNVASFRRPGLATAVAVAVSVTLWASAFVGIRAAGAHFAAGPLALGRLLSAASCSGD